MYFDELGKNVSPEALKLSEDLYEILSKLGNVSFGTGTSVGSYSMKMETKEGMQTIMHQWTDGRLEALSGYFSVHPLAEKYIKKLMSAISYSDYKVSKNWYRVDIPTNKLTEEDLNKLIEIYKELKEELLLQ